MIPTLRQTALAIATLATGTSATMAADTPKTAEVLLEADRVIELAFFSIEGGKERQIAEDYFPKIMPYMIEYGGELKGIFNVTANVEGDLQPQAIGVFAWDSLERRREMFNVPGAQAFFPIRDDALTLFRLGYFKVEQDTVLTLRSDRTYEFFNAWTTEAANDALPKYFENTAQVKTKYGSPQFIANLVPLEGQTPLDHLLIPDMAGIVEWVSTGAYYGLQADPDFLEHKPLLDASLEDFQMFHTSFTFP